MTTKNENVVDDWECIDDSELNTKVNQLKKSTTNQSESNTVTDCSRPFAAMLLNDDDCMRTQYVPPEPTVKILKRPTNDKNNLQSAEQKPKAPIKTLQQREQEYAEARLRILGSAKSAEDEQEEAAQTVNKNGISTPSQTNGFSCRNGALPLGNSVRPFNRNYPPPPPPAPSQPQYPNNFPSPAQQLQQQIAYAMAPELRRIDETVIRLPRGPDGSTGFMLKR